MTRKERVKETIKHRKTDFVPWKFGFTVPAHKKMADYYNDENFIKRIGNHIIGIEAKTEDAWEEVKPGFWKDEFGVIWNRTVDKDIGIVSNCIFEEPTINNGYKFPDPYKKGRFDKYTKFIDDNKEIFIMQEIGFSLFERAWTLRGMENLLCDMMGNPEFTEDLLDAIVDYNLKIIEQAVKYPVDGIRFGDDWGQQTGMIMGPKLWRRFLKPRLAKMYGKVKEAGLPVFIHSCGNIEEVLPDLIEIGLDVYNPFQPEVINIYEVKKKYGDKLSFWGGVSTQKLLPYGTPDDVKKEARKLINEIGRGGGYILAPAHAIPGDVPLENILALIDVVQNQ